MVRAKGRNKVRGGSHQPEKQVPLPETNIAPEKGLFQ